MDGQANDVYQVQKNYGGIHFYGSDGRPRIPSQVPGPTGNFVNQVGPLALADQALPAGLRRNGPHSAVFYGLPGSGRRAAVRVWIDRHVEAFPDGRFYADLS